MEFLKALVGIPTWMKISLRFERIQLSLLQTYTWTEGANNYKRKMKGQSRSWENVMVPWLVKNWSWIITKSWVLWNEASNFDFISNSKSEANYKHRAHNHCINPQFSHRLWGIFAWRRHHLLYINSLPTHENLFVSLKVTEVESQCVCVWFPFFRHWSLFLTPLKSNDDQR